MGLFSSQLSNVVEWQETREDVMFWKWNNDEIKKGSRLIIRPGQDAIFMYNGRMKEASILSRRLYHFFPHLRDLSLVLIQASEQRYSLSIQKSSQ